MQIYIPQVGTKLGESSGITFPVLYKSVRQCSKLFIWNNYCAFVLMICVCGWSAYWKWKCWVGEDVKKWLEEISVLLDNIRTTFASSTVVPWGPNLALTLSLLLIWNFLCHFTWLVGLGFNIISFSFLIAMFICTTSMIYWNKILKYDVIKHLYEFTLQKRNFFFCCHTMTLYYRC